MDNVRSVIEEGLKDASKIRQATAPARTRRPLKDERVAIRRMMSTYWDNSSIFGLDLVGAVIRQSSFVEKMHSIDWIHSPAVAATMSRLVKKYERYFQIMASYPSKVAVPTLDVDLAWRRYIRTFVSFKSLTAF